MRSATRSNLLRYGPPRVLRPFVQAAPLRIAPPQLNPIFISSATARRSFHASARALWATSDDQDANASAASVDEDDEISEQERQIQKQKAQVEAAFEEKERSDTYNRWVEAVRMELKNIETIVTSHSGSPDIEELEKIFQDSPAMASNRAARGTSKDGNIIIFDDKSRKPSRMPYVMLDPQWYKNTSEEERLQQVIAWRPFNARAVAEGKADQEFKEDPFSNKSAIFGTRTITEALRRKRLEKYIKEELANKRKVYSDIEKEGDDQEVTLGEMKKGFRAGLAMVESIAGEESSQEQIEPEVTKADKYIKPAGFVSATDMLKFSEEKLQADLDQRMKQVKKCVFCRPADKRPVLDPMNVPLLAMFMTPTGDIIGRRHNGSCRRHQRKLATTIKRAKHMGIFSYKYGGFTIYSPFHAPPALDIEEGDHYADDEEVEVEEEAGDDEYDEYEEEYEEYETGEEDDGEEEQQPRAHH